MAELIFSGVVCDSPGKVMVTVVRGQQRRRNLYGSLTEAMRGLEPLQLGGGLGKLAGVFAGRGEGAYLVHYAMRIAETTDLERLTGWSSPDAG